MSELWTLIKLLRWATDYFAAKGIESPRLDAELLLTQVLDLDRVGLYLNHDRPLSPAELEQLRPLVKRRGQREPLQYLIGHTEFWSLDFQVSPAVLIPRPDTEILVEEALAKAGEQGLLLDVGCGSGAIVISLANELQSWRCEGLDISAEALKIAHHNAQKHQVEARLRLYQGDLRQLPQRSYDLIVSNPPYITELEWETLMPEVREHEPRLALVADNHGLSCYQALTAQVDSCLNPGGWLLVEIGYQQKEMVRQLFINAGLNEVFCRTDYAGHPRIIGGRRPA